MLDVQQHSISAVLKLIKAEREVSCRNRQISNLPFTLSND